MSDAAKIAAGLSEAEMACILTWGDESAAKRAPIPDSIWHGELSNLKRLPDDFYGGWLLSPLGLAVRAELERRDD